MDTEADAPERGRTELAPDDGAQPVRPRRVRAAALLSRVPGGRLTLTALLLAALVLVVLRCVVQPFTIPSGSMEPGLRPGDRVLVNKLAYRFGGTPRRGDVVVFDGGEYFGDGDYIKRVVGVGGDRVVCCDSGGRLEVNGKPLTETRYLYPGDAASHAPFDVRVPEDRLFLLGDHRSISSDSRDRLGAPGGGTLPVDAVIGKAEWTVWPPGRWETVSRGATPPTTTSYGSDAPGEREGSPQAAQALRDVAMPLRDVPTSLRGAPTLPPTTPRRSGDTSTHHAATDAAYGAAAPSRPDVAVPLKQQAAAHRRDVPPPRTVAKTPRAPRRHAATVRHHAAAEPCDGDTARPRRGGGLHG